MNDLQLYIQYTYTFSINKSNPEHLGSDGTISIRVLSGVL